MKSAAIAAGCGTFAFVFVWAQMGMFSSPEPKEEAEVVAAPVVVVEKKKPAAPFPEALSPACKGQAVAEAAALDIKEKKTSYRLAFVKVAGGLHSWHSHLKEDWKAENVEQTELVVVLGPQRKTLLSVQTYANGAPPVSRYKLELEASIVAARSGKVLAYKHFVSMPRPVAQLEAWELTAIEEPVRFGTVFSWVASKTLAGFSE